jgi:hypothetical protein
MLSQFLIIIAVYQFQLYGRDLRLSVMHKKKRRFIPEPTALCEGTNSPRLFPPGETKALAESKVHQISRASVTNRGWSSSLISKIWRTVMNSEHYDWSSLKFAL